MWKFTQQLPASRKLVFTFFVYLLRFFWSFSQQFISLSPLHFIYGDANSPHFSKPFDFSIMFCMPWLMKARGEMTLLTHVCPAFGAEFIKNNSPIPEDDDDSKYELLIVSHCYCSCSPYWLIKILNLFFA